jgi:hypothetical protein
MPAAPQNRTPAECPVCGEPVPKGARACPNCGADERSGWNDEDSRYDGLDLPESAFADEDESAGSRPPPRKTASAARWISLVAITLIIVYLVLRGRF